MSHSPWGGPMSGAPGLPNVKVSEQPILENKVLGFYILIKVKVHYSKSPTYDGLLLQKHIHKYSLFISPADLA